MTKTEIDRLNRELHQVMDEAGCAATTAGALMVSHRLDLLLAHEKSPAKAHRPPAKAHRPPAKAHRPPAKAHRPPAKAPQ